MWFAIVVCRIESRDYVLLDEIVTKTLINNINKFCIRVRLDLMGAKRFDV